MEWKLKPETEPPVNLFNANIVSPLEDMSFIGEAPTFMPAGDIIQQNITPIPDNNSSDSSKDHIVNKKKEQNRAAQRAFRQRKEAKIQELTELLNQSKKENYSLKLQLDQLKQSLNPQEAKDLNYDFPSTKNEFIHTLLKDNTKHNMSGDNVNVSKTYTDCNQELLTISAVWDYLDQKRSSIEENGQELDIQSIVESLKGNERCHGYGPAYAKSLIDELVSEFTYDS
ncbi:BA75_04209T0 [Komagataella pastoris]|uniref:BA75_04209T0 n=1 Tax=Komagataella pastoris TaxID=4922 RepID=A0A1B2JFT2_PICPA|nr:BA75_04209T0 [Komagataella pastoris]